MKQTSPCMNKCVLDENEICTGCFRSLEEIKSWIKLTAEEQNKITNRVKTKILQNKLKM